MVNYSAFHYSEKARKALEEVKHIKETLGNIYVFKGSVNTVSDLPTNANVGDVYDVLDSGTNYAWTGDRWDSLGASLDLSEYAKKTYVDTTEQEIIKNFTSADTALQTQITGLSGVLDAEQDKITAIEGKIPTNASKSNMLSTASDLLSATQDVRSDFADADSELQTQINGQATAISDLSDDVTANMGEIADIKEQMKNVIDKTSATDRGTVVGWGMPDYSAGISKSKGVIYQAECDGFLHVIGNQSSTDSAAVALEVGVNSGLSGSFDLLSGYTSPNTNFKLAVIAPVPKGMYYRLKAATQGTPTFTFYPAKGAI